MMRTILFADLQISDLCGLLGVVVSVYCYARLQWRRDFAKELAYSVWNAIGAVLFEISLAYRWNPASFTGNLVWLLISLYGVYRCLKYRRRPAFVMQDNAPPTQVNAA